MATKSPLFREEPHYIPGYTGYVPQKTFNYGQTYGDITNKLLSNKEIRMSEKKVLAQTAAHPTLLHDESREVNASRFRMSGQGHKKLADHMVPGYTGYIPKSEKYFGRSSAKVNHKAIYDLETERWSAAETDRLISKTIEKGKMRPISQEAAPYVSRHGDGRPSTVSPYFMPTGCRDKNFITGYTGYIPQSRFKYSKVYRDQTKESLNDFTTTMQEQNAEREKPLHLQNILTRKPTTAPASTDIYRPQQGLVPRYTGYLPGHKYRYGVSYATSARMYNS